MDATPHVDRRGFVRLTAALAAGSLSAGAATAVCAEQAAPAGTAAPADQPKPPTIYIVDRLVVLPGKGKEVYDLYLEHFEPFAQERGLVLDRAVIAPPIWLVDDVSSNTLEFTWAAEGYRAFAGSITYGNADAAAWWADLETRCVSRDRSYFATVEDAEVLCNV